MNTVSLNPLETAVAQLEERHCEDVGRRWFDSSQYHNAALAYQLVKLGAAGSKPACAAHWVGSLIG